MGDVYEYSSQKFEGFHKLDLSIGIVSMLGLIDDEPGFGMMVKSCQVHGRALQITSEPMEAFGVVGIDRGVIVNLEPRMAPGQEQVDALLGDELAVSKKSKQLVAEKKLGLVGIEIGDGLPRAVTEEDPASDDGMNVWVPI